MILATPPKRVYNIISHPAIGVAPAIVVPPQEERHWPVWLFQCLGYSADICRCHSYFPVVQLNGLQFSVLDFGVLPKLHGQFCTPGKVII